MTTTAKVLQVLQLFKEGRKQVRAVDVIERLGVSSATAYRYIADLEEAGLIERASINEYVLGPTIVELDRQIRENDPLLAAAGEIMKSLSDRTGGIALLSRLHSKKVVCVHQVRGRFSPVHVSYERGRAMPLYRGATSKIILAHLEADTLRGLIKDDSAELRRAGLPGTFDALSEMLAKLRTDKVCATAGEVDREAMGWACALHQGKHLLGSLSVVMSRTAPSPDPRSIANQLLRAALRIEGRLEAPRPGRQRST
jgi:DNA-binding IclR family transcriptional regulator